MKAQLTIFCVARALCGAALIGVALFCDVYAEDAPAGAATERTSRRPRAYTERVEWHAMPAELDAPRQVEQPVETRPELFEMPKSPLSDVVVPQENMAPAYLYQQPPVRARDRDEKKKQRNWLVLKIEEQKEKEKTEDEREKRSRAASVTTEDHTGWGWLASAVLSQQDAQKAEAQAIEEEEAGAGTSVLATEALIQRATATQSGLMVTPSQAGVALVPAPAMKPMLDVQERASLSRVAIDEGTVSSLPQSASRGERPSMPVSSGGNVAPTLSGLAETPVFTTDPMKRDGSATPGSVLPRTAALLSRTPSPDVATKPPAAGGMTSMFQAERPTSAFDLSMPSANLSGSPFSRSSPTPSGGGAGGFFSAPRESGLGGVPARAAGSGLLMPSPPASGGIAPVRPTVQTEQPVSAPAFPTAPSWRK